MRVHGAGGFGNRVSRRADVVAVEQLFGLFAFVVLAGKLNGGGVHVCAAHGFIQHRDGGGDVFYKRAEPAQRSIGAFDNGCKGAFEGRCIAFCV